MNKISEEIKGLELNKIYYNSRIFILKILIAFTFIMFAGAFFLIVLDGSLSAKVTFGYLLICLALFICLLTYFHKGRRNLRRFFKMLKIRPKQIENKINLINRTLKEKDYTGKEDIKEALEKDREDLKEEYKNIKKKLEYYLLNKMIH